MSATFQEVVGAQSDIVDRVIIQADEPTETPDPSEELVYWYPALTGFDYDDGELIMSGGPANNNLSVYNNDERVFVYSNDSDYDTVAIDVATQERLWTYEGVSDAIYTDGEYVFIGAANDDLKALNISDGSVHFNTSDTPARNMREQALENGIVLTESFGNLYAYDTSTGDELWEADFDVDEIYNFDYDGQNLIVAGEDDAGSERIWKVDPDNGSEIETITGDFVQNNLYVTNELVLYQGSNDSTLYALDVDDITETVWEFSEGTPSASGGVMYENTIIQPMGGGISAVDLTRGVPQWRYSTDTQGGMDLHDGTLYFGTSSSTNGLDAETGDELYSFELNDDPEDVHAIPDEGVITYARSQRPIILNFGGSKPNSLGEPKVSSGEEWVEVGE